VLRKNLEKHNISITLFCKEQGRAGAWLAFTNIMFVLLEIFFLLEIYWCEKEKRENWPHQQL